MYLYLATFISLLTVAAGQDEIPNLPQYPNLCLNFVTSVQRLVNATSRNNGNTEQFSTPGPYYRPSIFMTPSRLVRRRCWQRFTSPAACDKFPELANNIFGAMSYLSYVYRQCHGQHIGHIHNGPEGFVK